MSAFATINDYEARYGAVIDQSRVTVLLEDASNYLLALYRQEWSEDYAEGAHALFDLNACAVTCAVVSRVVNVPLGMEGISSASQGADSYSASYTFANPTGDFYITKAEKERLGFTGGFIGTIPPMIAADRERGESGS